jgi:PAS domain S-box-containing protein
MAIARLNRPKSQNLYPGDATAQISEGAASILLVDDYPANLAALEAILEPLGHRLLKASSGRQAIALAAREELAVVLMDVHMPGLDGFKTAELMRSRWRAKSTPIIFLTAADTDATAILDGYARGAADFLVKPFEPEILRCKVAVFVDLYLKERTIKHQAAALRQQERQALERKSDLRFRKLIDAMPLCVMVTDNQGRPVYWNESMLAYTGVAAPDGVNSRDVFLDTIYPADREAVARLWNESVANNRQFEVKFRILRRDGVYRWHLGRGIPQRDDAEGLNGWIFVAIDIEIETQALTQAEAANRVKDEFLATVSHELRNPLNAIMGWVNLLHSGKLDTAGSKRALETIERNIHLQVSLIDEILDLSRIAKGKVHLELRTLDLIHLIEGALEAMRPAAEAKGLPLVWQWNGSPVYVNGDHERLQQVISNLISNAVKFTPPRGRVHITLALSEDEATLVVSDTGKGISAEFLPYVFDMFRQADSSTVREQYGLGLGLAIARRLVELHGGRIKAESEGVEKGATFSVTLPLQTSQAGPEQQRQASRVPKAEPGTLTGVRILLVEDHGDSREALAELLRRLGADTTTTQSAQEALAAVAREVPDVLISDIAMPGEDGYSLMESLKQRVGEQGRRIVSIALTGLGDPKHARRAIQTGFDLCMMKPLDLDHLVDYVLTEVKRRELK